MMLTMPIMINYNARCATYKDDGDEDDGGDGEYDGFDSDCNDDSHHDDDAVACGGDDDMSHHDEHYHCRIVNSMNADYDDANHHQPGHGK